MFSRWLPVLLFCAAGGAGASEPTVIPIVAGAVSVLETGGDIRTVVVANPEIADATVTAARKLFLLGRKTGRTGLLVIGTDGAPLLEATVTVGPGDSGLVTVNRGGKENTLTCNPRCVDTELGKSAPGQAAAPATAPPGH